MHTLRYTSNLSSALRIRCAPTQRSLRPASLSLRRTIISEFLAPAHATRTNRFISGFQRNDTRQITRWSRMMTNVGSGRCPSRIMPRRASATSSSSSFPRQKRQSSRAVSQSLGTPKKTCPPSHSIRNLTASTYRVCWCRGERQSGLGYCPYQLLLKKKLIVPL